MAEAASIKVNYQANTAAYTKKVEEARKETSSFSSTLKDLKNQFGKKSDLGQLATLLKGAGAIAGLKIISSEFAHLGEKAEELSMKVRSGEESFASAAAEFVRDIPILGSVVKGWDGITEAITGTKAAVAKIDEETKRTDALTDAIKALIATKQKLQDFETKTKADSDYERKLAMMPDGVAKEHFKLEHERVKAKEEASKKIDEIAEKETEKAREELAKQTKELDEWFDKQRKTFTKITDSTKGINPLSYSDDGSQQYQEYLKEATQRLEQLNKQKELLTKKVEEAKKEAAKPINEAIDNRINTEKAKASLDAINEMLKQQAEARKAREEKDRREREEADRAEWRSAMERDRQREEAIQDAFEEETRLKKEQEKFDEEFRNRNQNAQEKWAEHMKALAEEKGKATQLSGAEVRRGAVMVGENKPELLDEARKHTELLQEIAKNSANAALTVIAGGI